VEGIKAGQLHRQRRELNRAVPGRFFGRNKTLEFGRHYHYFAEKLKPRSR
jgi:hypothetical protein